MSTGLPPLASVDEAHASLLLISREVANELNEARIALEAFADRPEDRGALHRFAAHIHLARGALRLSEVYGGALLAEEMEHVARYVDNHSGEGRFDRDGLDALVRAMEQLPGYVERVATGARDLPLVLLPLLNDLRAARGSALLSEGTLLLLNLRSDEPARPSSPHAGDREVAELAKRLRPKFQIALLGWIRSENPEEKIRQMAEIASQFERAASTQPLFQLWWVVGAVLESLLSQGLEATVSIKRLLGHVDREMRRLQERGEVAYSEHPPTEILNNLLYYVSQSTTAGPQVEAVRQSFGLQDMVEAQDKLSPDAAEALSAPSVRLMRTVAAAIREDLTRVKDVLDIFVRKGATQVDDLAPQLELLHKISDTLGVLGLGALRARVEEELESLRAIVERHQPPDDAALLGIASALIAVEDSLDSQLLRLILPETVATDAPPGEPTDEDFRLVQEAVLRECIVNMARIKEAVTHSLSAPAEAQGLDQVPQLVRGITAGLLMLGKQRAVEVMESVGRALGTIVRPEPDSLVPARLDRLADAIVAVEYYMETLQAGRADQWSLLDSAEARLDELEPADTARVIPLREARPAADVSEPATFGAETIGLPPAPVEPPPAAVAPAPGPAVAAPTAPTSVDPEFVELFVEEAREHVARLEVLFPQWAHNPLDADALRDVRRAFHTLKGSGRMVGAHRVGEFAWSIESLLNRVISQTLARSPEIVEIVREAVAAMPALIDELDGGEPAAVNIQAIVARADDISGRESGAMPAPTAPPTAAPVETVHTPVAPPVATSAPEAATESAGMDPVLREIFRKETAGHVQVVRQYLERCASGVAPHPVTDALYRACHTLSGIAKTAGARQGIKVAEPMEHYVRKLYDNGHGLSAEGLVLLADTVQLLETVSENVDEHTGFFPEQGRLIEGWSDFERALDAELARLAAAAERTLGERWLADEAVSIPEMLLTQAPPRPSAFVEPTQPAMTEEPLVAPEPAATEAAVPAEPADIQEAVAAEAAASGEPGDKFEAAREIEPGVAAEPIDVLEALAAAEPVIEEPFFAPEAVQPEASVVSPEIAATDAPSVLDGQSGVSAETHAPVEPDVPAEIEPLPVEAFLAEEATVDAPAALEEPAPAFEAPIETAPTFESIEAASSFESSIEAAPTFEELEDAALTYAEPTEPTPVFEAPTEADAAPPEAVEPSQTFEVPADTPPGEVQAADEPPAFAEAPREFEAPAKTVEDIHAATTGVPDALEVPEEVSESSLLEDALAAEATFNEAFAEPAVEDQAPEPAEPPTETHEATPIEEPAHVAATTADEDFDADIAAIFGEEATELLEQSEAAFSRWRRDRADASQVTELKRLLHTLKGGARMAGIRPMGDLSHELESFLAVVEQDAARGNDATLDVLQASLDELHRMRDLTNSGQRIPPPHGLIARIRAIAAGAPPPAAEAASTSAPAVETTPATEAPPVEIEPIDTHVTIEAEADLEEVFGAAEREEAFEGAVARDDTAGPLADDTAGSPVPGFEIAASAPPVLPGREPTAPAERAELARVDAELLDELLNNAGEVSIFRARIEQQMTSIEFNLAELDRTVKRLREQLRKLEMETEAQILFKHQQDDSTHRADFDPLELDRYSTIQQLSRALAESCSDVASIEGLLETLNRDTQNLLQQQGRVITEVQNGLMRTRMVPFQRHVQRLTRLLRQAAQESGKKAELAVEGASGELDRQVLERMLPPFEHMLRNAVVHGIESPEERIAAGKPDTGRISMRLQREGAEVVIVVEDDGAGLNVPAIRDKARHMGLLRPEQSLTDEEALQLVLEPGFSTANRLTQQAGRGVGMDVVATEVKKLGGGLFIESKSGYGARFTIRLPFTLAITQALIVRVHDEYYALPMATVEGVARLPRAEIQRHLDEETATFDYGGNVYRFQHLGSFVGSAQSTLPETDTALPVILVRAGEHSTALVMDELLGSREIVVKSVGPQIAGIRGISGATILGDGRIVVILDMGTLVRSEWRARSIEGTRELRDDRIFALVVDDSITVRRVTQRLLERNGMRVLTAKDGIEALALLQEHVPDVVLLDIEMPRMDGYEVAAHVRSDARIADVPIIMITSRVGDKHRARAIEIGVDDYLGKPYQESQLLDAIEPLVLARRRQHD